MTVSDIAYLRQINAGLKAVKDANKDAIKNSMLPNMEIFKKIKKGNDEVHFSGLYGLQPNQAVKLAGSSIIIYKDTKNMFIPIELKKRNRVINHEPLLHDSMFSDAIKYKAKSKKELIDSIKNSMRDTIGLVKELKANNLSITKIFNLSSVEEQNDILTSFGEYGMKNILDNFDVISSKKYRVTKELYLQEWIKDPLTKHLQEEYEQIKRLLINKASVSEVLEATARLNKEVSTILDNNPLEFLYNSEPNSNLYFTESNIQEFSLKKEIVNSTYNDAFHNILIDNKKATFIIQKNSLEEIYPIETKDTIAIYAPASSVEKLQFSLLDYLRYQAEMKNEFKIMRDAYVEKSKTDDQGEQIMLKTGPQMRY